ncbi:poly-beta-1,6-N-acetyl-D-glucosamine N-deacetylase PgaB [Kangiella shandongensis]|uniref:poly-beta-1,6-N-acetyl-D-glucosamine N-deacetylase PgaB n=1 Tax=Kangiella shandongensis TaxID=2763258 RepID=UPI001CBF5D18|nr:poly-beta-1,6-N-acetyl-D-glucosamine N-deacetylase PgaB [Kangiella shandongensis]
MRRVNILLALLLWLPGVSQGKQTSADFFAFCYHDVKSGIKGDLQQDRGAVSTKHLIQHFEWIKDNGYTVVSLNDIIEAKKGNKILPRKSIYLTFDDGYKSFYTHIYPLLKLYNYPATFAIVTSWIESDKPVNYGSAVKTSSDFLTWAEIREMHQSGLIEIASHSHDMHRGVIANPQQNRQPAATSLIFSEGQYESEEDYKTRVQTDLTYSYELIKKHTGVTPKAVVWPYGSYSELAWGIAKDIGYKESLVLEQGQNTLSSEHIQRFLVSDNPGAADIEVAVEPYSYKQPHRAVHVDLDYVYDPEPEQQHKNLSLLLERIKAMKISHVYLQAFADEDGDGNASALYFPNRHLPVKADLFNRVAWQLKTRANVEVFAWMPVMAFDMGDSFYTEHGVYEWQNGKVQPSQNNYKRLSIFSEQSRQVIKDIYTDLARHSYVSGILFHDDAFLTDYEDVSPEALAFYKQAGIEFSSVKALSATKSRKQWTQVKAQALIDFTLELAAILERYNGATRTARNLYARPVINPDARQWFAQDLQLFTEHYDFTAIMAMPYMEQVKDAESWLEDLMRKVEQTVDKDKVVLELQTIDWREQKPVADDILLQQMELFMSNGFINYAYYPDDFINNHPTLKNIIKGMSLSSFPAEVTLYD